jgi:hypothetical protein
MIRWRAKEDTYLRFRLLPMNLLLLFFGLIIYPVGGMVVGLWEGLARYTYDWQEFWRIFIRGEG